MTTRRWRALLALLGLLVGLAPVALLPDVVAVVDRDDPPLAACLFISPNTEEGLAMRDAVRRLRSARQRQGRQLAASILRKLALADARVHDVVGDYAGEVENSLLVVVGREARPETLRRAAAWFGLEARQKAVLAFRSDPAGPAVLTRLDLPYRLAVARELLDSHGLLDRTLMPLSQGSRIYLLSLTGCDQERRLLQRLAHSAGGQLHEMTGFAELLAGATRDEARLRYQQVLAVD